MQESVFNQAMWLGCNRKDEFNDRSGGGNIAPSRFKRARFVKKNKNQTKHIMNHQLGRTV